MEEAVYESKDPFYRIYCKAKEVEKLEDVAIDVEDAFLCRSNLQALDHQLRFGNNCRSSLTKFLARPVFREDRAATH